MECSPYQLLGAYILIYSNNTLSLWFDIPNLIGLLVAVIAGGVVSLLISKAATKLNWKFSFNSLSKIRGIFSFKNRIYIREAKDIDKKKNEKHIKRAKSIYPQFYTKLVITGLSTFVVSSIFIYLFARITGFDVDEPEKIYKGLSYFLLIAGAVSANTCGRFTRTVFGKSITPFAIGAVVATWMIELVVWFSYYYFGVYYFPSVANEATGTLLFATLCMVGWFPITEN